MVDKVDVWVSRARYLLMALLGLIFIGAAVLTVQHFSDKKSAEAFGRLFEAQLIEEKAAKLGESDSALGQNDAKSSFLEVMKKLPEAERASYEKVLSEVRNDYPGTTASANASLKLARWYMENGRVEDTLPIFDSVIKDFQKSSERFIFAALAFEGKGSALEKLKKIDDAKANFELALGRKDNPLRPLAYLGLARTQIAKGDVLAARESYKKLADEFPGSVFETKAQALSALYVPANSPAKR